MCITIWYDLQELGILLGMVSDCEELVGEVNHTTECATDLFKINDVEWTIM